MRNFLSRMSQRLKEDMLKLLRTVIIQLELSSCLSKSSNKCCDLCARQQCTAKPLSTFRYTLNVWSHCDHIKIAYINYIL